MNDRSHTHGEVFTPLWLVDEMLDILPQEWFSDHKQPFLDPACGDGNFLVRVIQRKIDNDSTPTQALQTTYGVDIMEDNVNECKRRLLEIAGDTKEHRKIVDHNIVCANSLTEWDFENWKPLADKKEELVDDFLTF